MEHTISSSLCMILVLMFINEVQNQDSFGVVSRFGGLNEICNLHERVRQGEILFCIFITKIKIRFLFLYYLLNFQLTVPNHHRPKLLWIG